MAINKINVGGVKYDVYLKKDLIEPDSHQPVWGYTDYARSAIYIDNKLNKQHIKQTLIHELVHAMLCDGYNDEKLVNPLGNMLYSVLRSNNLKVQKRGVVICHEINTKTKAVC